MFKKSESLQSSKSLLLDRHTHDPWLSWKCISLFILSKFTPIKPNIFWGGPPDPRPNCDTINTFYNAERLCQMCFGGRGNTEGGHVYEKLLSW